jgi:hypothetical protein
MGGWGVLWVPVQGAEVDFYCGLRCAGLVAGCSSAAGRQEGRQAGEADVFDVKCPFVLASLETGPRCTCQSPLYTAQTLTDSQHTAHLANPTPLPPLHSCVQRGRLCGPGAPRLLQRHGDPALRRLCGADRQARWRREWGGGKRGGGAVGDLDSAALGLGLPAGSRVGGPLVRANLCVLLWRQGVPHQQPITYIAWRVC